jgi:zona occludens toxin
MINLLLGAPGGGKSYEATVYHILPALEKGRKVITNLPLNIEKIAQIDPKYADLIELRTKSKAEGMHGKGAEQRAWRPFEHEADYGDPWRNDKGAGPLYVIDECHMAMPKGLTRLQVEEWYSMHRHENADVLLITQSYGKMSAAIRDLVQIVYRVRKNVALGSMGSYTRKVQDGIRGEVVNTSQRTYQKKYFGLYNSHTRGKSAEELGAADVKPIWQHWSVILAVLCFGYVGYKLSTGQVKAPWNVQQKTATTKTTTTSSTATQANGPGRPGPVGPQTKIPTEEERATAARKQQEDEDAKLEPYAGRGLHLTGVLEMRGRKVWTFSLSQNGQNIAAITDSEVRAAGYEWHGESQCSGVLRFRSITRVVLCDAPQVGPNMPKIKPTPENVSHAKSGTQTGEWDQLQHQPYADGSNDNAAGLTYPHRS